MTLGCPEHREINCPELRSVCLTTPESLRVAPPYVRYACSRRGYHLLKSTPNKAGRLVGTHRWLGGTNDGDGNVALRTDKDRGPRWVPRVHAVTHDSRIRHSVLSQTPLSLATTIHTGRYTPQFQHTPVALALHLKGDRGDLPRACPHCSVSARLHLPAHSFATLIIPLPLDRHTRARSPTPRDLASSTEACELLHTVQRRVAREG